jgi:membrane protease YdiL (CAAX protease family)
LPNTWSDGPIVIRFRSIAGLREHATEMIHQINDHQPMVNGRQPSTSLAGWTIFTFLCLMVGWVAAWILKLMLETLAPWTTASVASFIYWTLAKLLLWVFPALWLIHLSGRSLAQVFNLQNYRSWLFWGGGIGLATGATEFVPNYLNGRSLLPTQWSYALANVLFVAPTFEELLMRGAVLANLERQYSFWRANVLTSLMFVILHLPGWYFMNSLLDNFCKPIGGAGSIFLASLAFGYAAKRSHSVMGGVLSHLINNLA